MPHDSTRIWRDIQNNIGITVGELGTFFGINSSYLHEIITRATITPWAKFKSVDWGGPIMTGKNSGSTYWQADGKCGFVIDEFEGTGVPSNTNSFAYKLLHNQCQWVYRRAQVGNSMNFRIADFDGYDAAAISPINPTTGITLQVNTNGELHIPVDITGSVNPDWLQLSDFTIDGQILTSWYLGAIIYYNDNAFQIVAQSQVTAQGADDIVFSGMTDWRGRTGVKVGIFLAKSAIAQTGGSAAVKCIAFDIPAQTYDIASGSGGFTFNPYGEFISTTQIEFGIAITNSGISSVLFGGVVSLYKDGQWVKETQYSHFEVAAGSTGVKTLIMNEAYDDSAYYEAVVTCNGQSQTIEIGAYDPGPEL